MSESTALVAALLSAWLASRRNLVLPQAMRNHQLHITELYIPPSSGANSEPGVCRHRRKRDPSEIGPELVGLCRMDDVRTVYQTGRG